MRLEFVDWISKTRSEIYFREHDPSKLVKPVDVRGHWQYMMGVGQLEEAYPYLKFAPLVDKDDDAVDWGWDGEPEYSVKLKRSRCVLHGGECGGEFVRYEAKATFNALGRRLHEAVTDLIGADLVGTSDGGKMISVAPWHSRDI